MKKRIGIIIIFIILLALCEYFGIIQHNKIFTYKYNVKGIDVSHWQNKIEWNEVKEDNVEFVYIKATEGNDFIDNMFSYNWNETKKVNLKRGAYHYFTTGSSGKEQGNNFIKTVPNELDSLPPVIDIEVGGLPKEQFNRELNDFIKVLENEYGKKPILYVMYPLYESYIKDEYKDYKIWIRDIVKPPQLSDGREWAIWQYSNRGRIKGIETYVDLNVSNLELEDL